MLVLASLAAAQLERWHGCGCSQVNFMLSAVVPARCHHPRTRCRSARRLSSCAGRSHVHFPYLYSRARRRGFGVLRFAGRRVLVHVPLPVLPAPARTSRSPATPTCATRARRASPWQPANKSLQRTLANVAKIHSIFEVASRSKGRAWLQGAPLSSSVRR